VMDLIISLLEELTDDVVLLGY